MTIPQSILQHVMYFRIHYLMLLPRYSVKPLADGLRTTDNNIMPYQMRPARNIPKQTRVAVDESTELLAPVWGQIIKQSQ